MRGLISIFLMLTAIIAVTCAYRSPINIPRPNQSGFPSFPGQGPFNQRRLPIPIQRYRRSPEGGDKGKISIHGQKDGPKSSWGLDFDHTIWGNQYGSIGINGGINKDPNHKPETHLGLGGQFHFG